jgi:transcriptional regulator
MYVPPAFAADDPAMLEAMLGRAGLGILVTHGPAGLFASHLPILRDGAGFTGHLARSNPHRERAADGEALLIFPGPEAYISPSWHPSKAEHGRAVPTWDYEAIHVYGVLSWFDDRDGLLDVVARLSDAHEQGRPQPWSTADAPNDYIERLLRGIVGLRLQPTRIEAKRKLSQTRKPADRAGVIAGLEGEAHAGAAAVAELTRADVPA